MKKMLVILGPTATGKTDLAIDLAKKLNGELVSVDSRQVYIGLNIGTGKLPGNDVEVAKGEGYWDLGGVRVWMYDVADPKDRYHVSQYVKDAENAIQNISQEGKLPILVGGTGLYLKGLLEGFPTLNLGVDEKLREKLEKSGVGELQKKLQALSPIVFEKMNDSDKKNPRRLIRQIEILTIFDKCQMSNTTNVQCQMSDNNVLKIGLNAPRPVLNQRIDNRIFKRLKSGMLEEAKGLLENGLSVERMRSLGLEYVIESEYLRGETSYEQMVEKLRNKIHQYAKRQMTWFKKDKSIFWFDITEDGWREKVEKRVIDWYNIAS